MKYFFDTEFIEDGKTIDLISIGIVAEDGRELYCESSDANLDLANDWVKANIIPHLWRFAPDKREPNRWSLEKETHRGGLMNRSWIRDEVSLFCNPEQHGKPEFWAYYADYDWVALCQLFGTMMQLPDGWPMYCRDLKQWCDMLGNPKLPEQTSTEHNALADARWNQEALAFLEDYAKAGTVGELIGDPA